MKSNIIRYALLLLALSVVGITMAQQAYVRDVTFKNLTIDKSGSNIYFTSSIDLSQLHLESNRQIQLMPVLVSEDGQSRIELPYVLIQGSKRYKVYSRKEHYNNLSDLEKNAYEIIYRNNGTIQELPYAVNIPLNEQMKRGTLHLYAKVTGCATCDMVEESQLIEEYSLYDYIPAYSLTYIVPEAEPVKARSAKFAAHFNFKQGRHELVRDYKDNAREFDRIDAIFRDISTDKDLTISGISIVGYASPEGTYSGNMALSKRRANAFADYVRTKHQMSGDIKVSWEGEDWDGLKEAVQNSSLTDKQEIIKIINSVSNPDARDAKIAKLSGGATFEKLLRDFYPPLRRNECTVSYVARPFDLEEAKTIIKTKPQLLSLNEMYLLAKSYPADSNEFKEVFDIATRMFPVEPVAIINSAAADIERGDYKGAIKRLNKIEGDSRAWNNLGVAYARIGDFESAKRYFQKAENKGDQHAKHNLEELNKAIADKK